MTTVWAANVLPLQAPFCYWQFWWEIRDRKIRGECDCRANARFHNPDNLRIKTIHVYPRSLRRENGHLTIQSCDFIILQLFSSGFPRKSSDLIFHFRISPPAKGPPALQWKVPTIIPEILSLLCLKYDPLALKQKTTQRTDPRQLYDSCTLFIHSHKEGARLNHKSNLE